MGPQAPLSRFWSGVARLLHVDLSTVAVWSVPLCTDNGMGNVT